MTAHGDLRRWPVTEHHAWGDGIVAEGTSSCALDTIRRNYPHY